MTKYAIIEISNRNTSFYVIGAEVIIGKTKNKPWVSINGKKIYGLFKAEIIREVLL